jgi:hypothetical protein
MFNKVLSTIIKKPNKINLSSVKLNSLKYIFIEISYELILD